MTWTPVPHEDEPTKEKPLEISLKCKKIRGCEYGAGVVYLTLGGGTIKCYAIKAGESRRVFATDEAAIVQLMAWGMNRKEADEALRVANEAEEAV